jgi:hypothetical protein
MLVKVEIYTKFNPQVLQPNIKTMVVKFTGSKQWGLLFCSGDFYILACLKFGHCCGNSRSKMPTQAQCCPCAAEYMYTSEGQRVHFFRLFLKSGFHYSKGHCRLSRIISQEWNRVQAWVWHQWKALFILFILMHISQKVKIGEHSPLCYGRSHIRAWGM